MDENYNQTYFNNRRDFKDDIYQDTGNMENYTGQNKENTEYNNGDYFNQYDSIGTIYDYNNANNNYYKDNNIIDKTNYFDQYDKVNNINNQSNIGYGDRIKEILGGTAKGFGSVPDVVNKYVAAPIANTVSAVSNAVGLESLANQSKNLSNQWENSNISGAIGNSEFLKKDYKPDTMSKINESVGEGLSYILPMNQISSGLKILSSGGKMLKAPWIEKIARILYTPLNTTGISSTVGANAGASYGNSLVDDPKNESGKILSSLSLGLLGGIFAAGIAKPSISSVKSISNLLIKTDKEPLSLLKNSSLDEVINVLPKDVIDKKTIKMLKDTNTKVDLTHVYKKDKMPFIVSYLLPEKIFKKSLESLNDSSLKTIENNLNKRIYNKDALLETDTAINNVERIFSDTLKKRKDIRNSLYATADSLASDKDVVKINNVFKEISELRPIYDALPVTRGDRAGFINILNTIEDNMLVDNLPLKKAIEQRKSLNSIIKSLPKDGKEQQGRELKNIIQALDKDILESVDAGTITNSKYVDAYKKANNYYKDLYIPMAKLDISKTILSQEKPYYLYDLLKNSVGIKKFDNFVSTVNKDKNLSNKKELNDLASMLKRTKLQEIIFDNTKSSDNSFDTNYLKKIFKTPTKENYLRSLAGDKLFKELKKHNEEITPVLDNLKQLSEVASKSVGNASFHKSISSMKNLTSGALIGFTIGKTPLMVLLANKIGMNMLLSKINSDEKLLSQFLKLSAKSNNVLTKEMLVFLNRTVVKTQLLKDVDD